MDPIVATVLDFIPMILVGVVVISVAGIAGSVFNTRQKIKAGYPLEGMWGQSLRPTTSNEGMERIKLLTQENAALRAEVSAVKERLANVERIVTDSGYHLSHQIAALGDAPDAMPDAGRPLNFSREKSPA
jgi:hypothetical protein